MDTIIYNQPILYNNGAAVVRNIQIPLNRNKGEYVGVQNANRISSYVSYELDLKPTLQRFLNNYGNIKEMTVSMEVRMAARGWREASILALDNPQWGDTHSGEMEEHDKKFGASIDIFLDNIISTKWENGVKYIKFKIQNDFLLKYKGKLQIGNSSPSLASVRAAGSIALSNITIESIEYYPNYTPIEVKLAVDKTKLAYGFQEETLTFSYQITDAEKNRLVRWTLYRDAGVKIATGNDYAGSLTLTADSAHVIIPTSKYYILADGQSQSGAKSNVVSIQIEPGQADLSIAAMPPYIRYQDQSQEIKVTGMINSIGGMSRNWVMNKKINNNHQVLASGYCTTSSLNKVYFDKVNPLNTITPVRVDDVIEYKMLDVTGSPAKGSAPAIVEILDYNINNVAVGAGRWKTLNRRSIMIPPYTKRLIKNKTLVDIFGFDDSDVNAASKVKGYRISNWGGMDVSAKDIVMNGIIGTVDSTELFILDKENADTTTARKAIDYHLYLTRKDLKWNLTFPDVRDTSKTFMVNGQSYANGILSVIYRIDKLPDPKEVKLYRNIANVAADGEIQQKKEEARSFLENQDVIIEWVAESGTYSDFAGFTFEFFDTNHKKVYQKEIEWTDRLLARNGNGYSYHFSIPQEISEMGSGFLNIVAINEYNNSIKTCLDNGFTWADSNGGDTKALINMTQFNIVKKRRATQLAAPCLAAKDNGVYTFKYPRNPFLLFDADTEYLDEFYEIPIENPETSSVSTQKFNAIWYHVKVGLPVHEKFDYWRHYLTQNWKSFKTTIINWLNNNIVHNNIQLDKLTDEKLQELINTQEYQQLFSNNGRYPQVILDSNGDLRWQYVINGCRKLWQLYQTDNLEEFEDFFGVWKEFYNIGIRLENFQKWSDVKAQTTIWEKLVHEMPWDNLRAKKYPKMNVDMKFALIDIDNFLQLNGNSLTRIGDHVWKYYLGDSDYPWLIFNPFFTNWNEAIEGAGHNIMGKVLMLPYEEAEMFNMVLNDNIFYDETTDRIGIQFLRLLKAYIKQDDILSNILLEDRISTPYSRFNIEITSAYGLITGSTVVEYLSTLSVPLTFGMTSVDLIEPAKLKQRTSVNTNQVIYNPQGPYFGPEMAYLIDMTNDICRYYDNELNAIGTVNQSGIYSYNQLAGAAAKALKYFYNPYPYDILYDPQDITNYHPEYPYLTKNTYRINLKKELEEDDSIIDLMRFVHEDQHKTVYTEQEAQRSIYNVNNFTNHKIINYIFKIIEDQ